MPYVTRLNTVRSWIGSFTLVQQLVVCAGIALFFLGLLISDSPWKAVILLLSGALVALSIVMRIGKKSQLQHSASSEVSFTQKENGQDMKKLIFDDFQAAGQYKIDFVDDSMPRSKPQMPKPMAGPIMHAPEKSSATTFDLTEFVDSQDADTTENGPRAEFNVLIKRVLTVVKEVHFAHTVALFWINREKQQLVLENHVTESEVFSTHQRLPLGGDLPSQVATAGRPQIVNYVNALSQAEVLPYYEGKEDVKTFVGVPIFYTGHVEKEQKPVAVLIMDCREADAYGAETMTSMAQVAKMISTLIRSYTSKYDLLIDSEVLRSLGRMRERLSMNFSVPVVTQSLADEASRLIPWDYITVVLYNEARNAWVVQHVLNRMNDPYVPLLSEVDAEQSLVASVIQSSAPQVVENVNLADVPRFYPAERCDSKGALLLVPLNSLTRCYGVLVVESKDTKAYSDADMKLIQKLTEVASWALEVLSLTEVMHNFVTVDEATGVATRKYFLDRLQEEVTRSNDFSAELSLVLISIDHMDEQIAKHGKDTFEFVLQNVGRMVKSSVRSYDIVGRYDQHVFGVVLINTTSNEASLWAEKIRKNVASNIMNMENKSFSVTVSVGVAGALVE
ncbi:MAG TPA: diguanylate cyclase, partial [Bacteroidota bacterium]|nr:diguanylate cyclase [Bacteroidota bacterium]